MSQEEINIFIGFSIDMAKTKGKKISKKIKQQEKKKPSEFAERVYAKLKLVPLGKVTTYKSLAEAVRCKGFQAIGQVMNKNPYAPVVPCHRVIQSNGLLGGFAHGLEKKIEMLKSEGIEIVDNRIDLKKFEFTFEK